MHISDGVLPIEITASGWVISGLTLFLSTKSVDKEEIPKISLFTAVFFVSSLIHIPVPPTSVHLILSGLVGIVLGRYSFAAIMIGLLFQALMFQHGGILALGINAFNLGMPALLVYFLFDRVKKRFYKSGKVISFSAFAFSFFAIILSSLFVAAELYFTSENFYSIVVVFFIGALITAVIEGTITFFIVGILYKNFPVFLDFGSQEKQRQK